MTVVGVVGDAQRRAVLKNNAPGALKLNCEDIERILEPADFKPLPIERAGLDGTAVIVSNKLVLLVEATNPAFIWKGDGAGLVAGGDQVRRTAVEREMKDSIGKSRALNDRLEITSQKTVGPPRRAMRTGWKFCSKKARAAVASGGRRPVALWQTVQRAA